MALASNKHTEAYNEAHSSVLKHPSVTEFWTWQKDNQQYMPAGRIYAPSNWPRAPLKCVQSFVHDSDDT